MTNPSRKKGTAFETEIVNLWNAYYGAGDAHRNPASASFDITTEGSPRVPPIEVLVTKSDRGEVLGTMRFSDLLAFGSNDAPIHIECKRLARISIHEIFRKKFGKRKQG